MNYIIYYPKGEKYISLFKDPGEQTKVLEKRDMIKKDVERQMMQGTLGRRVVANPLGVDGEKEVAEKRKEKNPGRTERGGGEKDEEVKTKKRKENVPAKVDDDGGDEFFNF